LPWRGASWTHTELRGSGRCSELCHVSGLMLMGWHSALPAGKSSVSVSGSAWTCITTCVPHACSSPRPFSASLATGGWCGGGGSRTSLRVAAIIGGNGTEGGGSGSVAAGSVPGATVPGATMTTSPSDESLQLALREAVEGRVVQAVGPGVVGACSWFM
jgi:hypothetical protein